MPLKWSLKPAYVLTAENENGSVSWTFYSDEWTEKGRREAVVRLEAQLGITKDEAEDVLTELGG